MTMKKFSNRSDYIDTNAYAIKAPDHKHKHEDSTKVSSTTKN